MDKAKAAVSDFMHKAGHHDTTVHEKVAPAVVKETVSKHRHEEATTAIDREVHQDHFHTSIQPIKDREVLPERHEHNMMDVETREHRHGDENAIKARLEQERAQFKNTRTEGQVRESHSVAPVIAGEHVHHHVHETIQPIVQKETIQPSVVHTTIPIHEIHHNEAKHHAASALPAVSMADFKKQGGSLTGREERYDGFEGEPRAVGSALGGSSTTGSGVGAGRTGTNTTGSGYDNYGDNNTSRGTTGSGLTGVRHGGQTTAGPHTSSMENKLDPRVDSDLDGSRGISSSRTGGTGTIGSGYGNTTDTGYGNTTSTGYGTDGNTRGSAATTGSKPGLMDRLNPMKDTDGDGKKGFME